MPADLTRFDFHAFRFMRSEDVRAMSAEEVGQYILLLCEAWLTGKDSTLPNDPQWLARLARVFEVSPRVMKKFSVVQTQWGERLQNETLFEEWQIASNRSDNGRKAVEVRWNNARNTDVLHPPAESYIPKPIQSVSNQSNPTQANDSGNFKNLAVRYRRAFHVNLSHGTLQKEEYAKRCREFSEDVLLEKFDEWAPDNMWIKERRHTNGLRQFYESLPAMVEADVEIKADEEKEQQVKNLQVNAELDAILAAQKQHAQEELELAAKRQEEEEIANRVAADPNALFQ